MKGSNRLYSGFFRKLANSLDPSRNPGGYELPHGLRGGGAFDNLAWQAGKYLNPNMFKSQLSPAPSPKGGVGEGWASSDCQ